MEELDLACGGLPRRAVVHAPRSNAPRPVVVLLHGSGGTGEWALRESRWDERADAEGCLVVAPDAARADLSLPMRFYTNPAVWNDGSGRPPAEGVGHIDDVAFIRQMLDAVGRGWAIDPARVFVTGFSNGAGMTFRLARELSDRIAAIAPVAGHMPPGDAALARPVPTIYLTGTADPLIPLNGGHVNTPWARGQFKPPIRETLTRWAAAMRLPFEPREVIEGAGVRRETWPDGLLEAWLIAGLGHHWPGGRAGLNPRIAGPPSSAVDATKVIWEFFARTGRP